MAKSPDTQSNKPVEASKRSRNPRIRKPETIRERNQKAITKAETKANKPSRRQTATRPFARLLRPLKKPLGVLARPFRTRPVRFIGRVLGRIFWPKYFRNAWNEVRQVIWPSRRDTWKLTLAVLVFALAFGLVTSGVDFVLDKVIKRLVFRA